MSRFYYGLARRKTSQEAVMATARKMLKVVYWMLLSEESYHSESCGCDPASPVNLKRGDPGLCPYG